MRTILSEWLKNLIASVYSAKSFVCCTTQTSATIWQNNDSQQMDPVIMSADSHLQQKKTNFVFSNWLAALQSTFI